MRVGLAADHEGFELKQRLLAELRNLHIEVQDYGAFSLNSTDDYPDFIIPMAQDVATDKIHRGIAICGSGIGACVAANKVQNVRAGIVDDLFSARQGVEDDDMNVICIGARLVPFPLALDLVRCFLETKFSGLPRHLRRLAKISQLEKTETSS